MSKISGKKDEKGVETPKGNDSDKIINDLVNKGKKKRLIIVVIICVLIAFLIGFLLIFNPFGGHQQESKDTRVYTSVSSSANNAQFWMQDGKEFPISLTDWQKTYYAKQDQNALNKAVIDSLYGTEIGTQANTLPSEAAGYTSDKSQEKLPDGTLNPMYSAWTREAYESWLGKATERMINPTFGDWQPAQYSWYFNDKTPKDVLGPFTDLFTPDLLNKFESDPSSSPIWADWNKNDYGMKGQLLDSGPRWYGQITSSESTFDYNLEKQTYTANVKINVQYTAWTQSQQKVQKNGVITLKIAQPDYGTGFVISDANFKME